jgi:hypothetical protein
MEELLELKKLIHQGNIQDALLLISEMEEMSKEDKINKIYSYCIVLLVHLIKQNAEKRTTRSWQVSIDLAVDKIQRINKRQKAGGTYMNNSELRELLGQSYRVALKQASLEAFEGIYDANALGKMVDFPTIINQAMNLIEQL